MLGTRQNGQEPGLLQVFRWFSILRMVLLFGTLFWDPPARGSFEWPTSVETSTNLIPLFFLLMLMLTLYLYWERGQRLLGKLYLPIALLFASVSLLLEPYFLTPIARFWQPDSFLLVLLILVAW